MYILQQNTPCGGVAQLGEHLPCKQGVRSSILLISTTYPQEGGFCVAKLLKKHFALQNANDTDKKVSAEKDAKHPQKLTVSRSGIQGVMCGST